MSSREAWSDEERQENSWTPTEQELDAAFANVSKNPHPQGCYEWHSFEMKRADNNKFNLVWVHNDFFWDYTINRPKAFPKKESHLYAILFIISGRTGFVLTEDAESYYQKKYFAGRETFNNTDREQKILDTATNLG